jgi:hypothetical protein
VRWKELKLGIVMSFWVQLQALSPIGMGQLRAQAPTAEASPVYAPSHYPSERSTIAGTLRETKNIRRPPCRKKGSRS